MRRVYLLGFPLSHSVSPAMQNAAFRACDLNWQYEAFMVSGEDLGQALALIKRGDCAGANITIPHKQSIMPLLDAVSEQARQIGAVNTIVNRAGRLIGENTDADGFLQALREEQVKADGARCVVLGAGGAGHAVAFALARAGAESITILNRTPARALALAERLRANFPAVAFAAQADPSADNWDIVVNTTSVGMSPLQDASPLPPGLTIRPGAVIVDLVYRPLQTKLLLDAEKRGARTISGLRMLVHQGAAAFTLWTGRQAPVELMARAAEKALRS